MAQKTEAESSGFVTAAAIISEPVVARYVAAADEGEGYGRDIAGCIASVCRKIARPI